MFDFAWTEVALIGVVALVAIGPKDLPVAIKTVANMVKKARKMAGEFQTHVDEMVRDADLTEVRDQIGKLRNLDIKGTIERAVDTDGSIRRTMNDDPFTQVPGTTPAATQEVPGASFETRDVPVAPTAAVERPDGIGPDTPPAFVPPRIATVPDSPAFVPPAAARARRAA